MLPEQSPWTQPPSAGLTKHVPRVFEHPANGYREQIDNSVIGWTLVIGPIYLALKGLWTFAIIQAVGLIIFWGVGGLFGAATLILVGLYTGSKVKDELATSYLRKGWREVPTSVS
jgi:hypothetical protein